MLGAWVGPAVVAALIAAIVSAVGWFVSTRQALSLDRFRRLAKTRDIQIALRAEIRGELANMRSYDFDGAYNAVAAQSEEDGPRIVLLKSASNFVFHALVAEIHLLPADVIDPVVLYMRQCEIVGNMIDTFATDDFHRLPQQRKLVLAADYIALKREQMAMAEQAVNVLDRAVGGPVSRKAADRFDP